MRPRRQSDLDPLGLKAILSLSWVEVFAALDLEDSDDFVAFDWEAGNARELLTSVARQNYRRRENECDPTK